MPSIPATVVIHLIEGRGIWLKMTGDLLDGTLDQPVARLGQLARLGFRTVVVDLVEVSRIDHTGVELLRDFVSHVAHHGGTVQAIDSTKRLLALLAPPPPALIVAHTPPAGGWWI